MYEFNSAAKIWLKHQSDIRIYCEVELNNAPELIDNAFNEVYLALVEAVNNEVGIIDPYKWLLTTAHNIVVMSLELPSSFLVSNSQNELDDLYLNDLPPEYKAVLINRFRKRLSISAIAKEYEITEGLIKQRLRRAKDKYFLITGKQEIKGYRPGTPKQNKVTSSKYLVSPGCIADTNCKVFFTEHLTAKKHNCGKKAWRALDLLIEKSLENKYVLPEDLCSVYFGEEEIADWSLDKCIARAGSIARNLNRIIGTKAIVSKNRKGYKLKDTPIIIPQSKNLS